MPPSGGITFRIALVDQSEHTAATGAVELPLFKIQTAKNQLSEPSIYGNITIATVSLPMELDTGASVPLNISDQTFYGISL